MTEVAGRAFTIWSEGTRLAADLFTPEGEPPRGGWPAVLLCHGWGGLKSHLAVYARRFTAAGYAALVFDYRGWGESDGRVIATEDAPPLLEAGERTLKVRVLREIVDPIDQVADIRNALAVLAAEPGVDAGRIAVWGSSYGGGHAVWIAGWDDRIRCAVAQIGGYDLPAEYRAQGRARAVDKALGRIDPVVPQDGLDAIGELKGSPDIARMVEHSQLAGAERIRVPTLFMDAEFEELNDRWQNGWFAHLLVRRNAPSEYVTFPGRHYDVYDRFFEASVERALDWFGRYL